MSHDSPVHFHRPSVREPESLSPFGGLMNNRSPESTPAPVVLLPERFRAELRLRLPVSTIHFLIETVPGFSHRSEVESRIYPGHMSKPSTVSLPMQTTTLTCQANTPYIQPIFLSVAGRPFYQKYNGYKSG
jgi:hypothetical protein